LFSGKQGKELSKELKMFKSHPLSDEQDFVWNFWRQVFNALGSCLFYVSTQKLFDAMSA